MRQTISEIRKLLDKLDAIADATVEATTLRVFSGLELPDILRDVVDLLIPLLEPYEAAFYFYFLRHAVIETGNPLIRVSTYKLQSGVVKSLYSLSRSGGKEIGNSSISLDKVRSTLRGLEAAGAIRKEGEPNSQGTPYRILLPEEIEACREARAARDVVMPVQSVDETEIDYYNIRENRLRVYERDSYKCQYCDKQLTRFTSTLDHVRAVAQGGDNSFVNLITACRECNSKKNSRLLGDFVADTNPA